MAGRKIICALALFTGIAPSAAQIYVKQDAIGANNGTSWTDAFVDLQPALTSAGLGSDIWVARGIYSPGAATSDTFALIDTVRVLGGFIGNEILESDRNPLLNITTLSGELGLPGTADNIEIIVTATSPVSQFAVLDGFHIVGAAQHGISINFAFPLLSNLRVTDCGQEIDPGLFIFGGGISIEGSTATPVRLTDCEFSRNSASAGGGLYMENGAVAEFLRCAFNENAARYPSGGGGAAWIRNQSNATFKVCAFSENFAVNTNGGAMSLEAEPTVKISHSVFIDNRTVAVDGGGGNGGAIFSHAGESPPTPAIRIHDCIFSGNHAEGSANSTSTGCGGATCMFKSDGVEIANCLFYDNTADSFGGATYSFANKETYTNCTIAHCFAPQAGGSYVDMVPGTGKFSTWRNVIIWNCTHNGTNDETKSIDVTSNAISDTLLDYCCIDDGFPLDSNVAYGFPTVIDVDPLFANETERAFQLRINSPCIDAANTPPIPIDSLDADLDNVFTEKSPDQQFLRRVFDDPVVPNVNGIPNSGGDPEECGISDMGAFERQTHCESGVQGDYDANGLANGLDIQPFVHCYISGLLGTLPCSCSDINMNGFYTFQDVTCLIDILLMRGWCEVQTNCDIPGGGEGGEGDGEGEGRQMMMQSPGGANDTGDAAAGLGKKTESDSTATTPANEPMPPPEEVEDPAFNARWNAFVEWLEANWIDQYPEMTEEAWNEMATQKMIEMVYQGVVP